MKQLGMTDKQEILEMGIDNFNDAARASVLKYTNEWEQYVYQASALGGLRERL